MNKRWLRIEIMVRVIFAVSIVGLVKGDDKTTVAEFDKAYSSWRKYVLEGPRSDLTSNPYYRAMVQLGPSAVPLLMEKIQVDPPARTLISTVQRLTKKRFMSIKFHLMLDEDWYYYTCLFRATETNY